MKILLTLVAASALAHASTVIVDANNFTGWTFGTTGDGTTNFVGGPATPPLGIGSLNLNSGTQGNQITYAAIQLYDGLFLKNLTTLSYDAFGTSWNGAGGQLTYLKLYIDLDGDGTVDDALYFEPAYQYNYNPLVVPNQQAVALDVWQSWNVATGGFWNDLNDFGQGAGVNTLANYLALAGHADAKLATITPYGGAIRFTVGAANPGDVFNAYIDNFNVSFSGAPVTTYDLEGVPEPATWALMAAGLILIARRAR